MSSDFSFRNTVTVHLSVSLTREGILFLAAAVQSRSFFQQAACLLHGVDYDIERLQVTPGACGSTLTKKTLGVIPGKSPLWALLLSLPVWPLYGRVQFSLLVSII